MLEQATIAHPGNKTLLAAYGRALADNGNSQAAFDVLGRAHSPDNPDWRILSVQGTVLDKLGKHDEARRYYATALKIAPEEPSVLSNLGLSYMLTRELPDAEETLRRAYGNPRGGRARCGKIWRWWSACRVALPKPRPSPRATCRPTRRRRTWPIAGNAERKKKYNRAAAARPFR